MPHAFQAAIIGVLLMSRLVVAQDGATASVRGVVYDSLRSAPLANAAVTIVGTARRTIADGEGRFRFDSVPPGTHTFAAQHAALDSLGFSGVSARATVGAGRDLEVTIGAPSFATLWRAACGGRAPKDSGFVYGTVRAATTGEPVPNAVVSATWLDLTVDRSKRVRESRWRGQSRSDSTGSYGICGIPTTVGLRVRAGSDSAASGLIDLPGYGLRVQRRDLVVAPVGDAGVAIHGSIAGVVTDTAGRPFADARVIVEGAPEIRSGPDGRFALGRVPAGTRQLEVLALGMRPVMTAVDIPVGDTVRVHAALQRVTVLDVVRVTAGPATRRLVEAFEERRRTGFGYSMDSTQIASRGTLPAVFHSFPSVQVEYTGAGSQFLISLPSNVEASGQTRCLANVVIDGRKSDHDEFFTMRPSEIAAVEVYPRAMSAPLQFLRNVDCGVVVVWTKWMFGGR